MTAPVVPEAAPVFAAPEPASGRPAAADGAPRADEAITAYVGFFAGYFEIGRLAAGRRLNRAGVRTPLLHA